MIDWTMSDLTADQLSEMAANGLVVQRITQRLQTDGSILVAVALFDRRQESPHYGSGTDLAATVDGVYRLWRRECAI